MNQKPWLKHYDAHVPSSLRYPKSSIVGLLDASVQEFPDNTCLIFEDFEFSYSELGFLSDRLASGLIRLGIKPGEKVGIVLPNIPQFIITYFGILKAGAIVVAINPQYRSREIIEMVDSSQVETLFCLSEKIKEILDVKEKSGLKKVVNCQMEDLVWLKNYKLLQNKKRTTEKQDMPDYSDLFSAEVDKGIFALVLPEQPAVFQFTGGTTGTPKAAIGLHSNLVANTRQFITWCDLKSGKETVLAVIPLYHVYGMVLALCLGIALGAKIVLIYNPKDIDKVLRSIEKYQVSFFPGVPSMYYAINQNPDLKNHKYRLNSIRACISGSATLHPEIKRTFELLTGGKLIEGYGLSEAPTATHCNPLYGENRTGSIGLPLPDVDCQVVDLMDYEKKVGIGEIGELVIKGPQVMRGYFNDENETAQTLQNGWLRTGDIVRMDLEGYFYVVDRKKSLIKVSGFQVWPNEIEQVLGSHPDIKEAAAGGVPDREQGERVIAWVVMKPQRNAGEKEIKGWCRNNLAAYKVPSEIIFVEEIPKTSVGKILRRELIRQYPTTQK
jgi:long-chain acyl-CoA synthetase